MAKGAEDPAKYRSGWSAVVVTHAKLITSESRWRKGIWAGGMPNLLYGTKQPCKWLSWLTFSWVGLNFGSHNAQKYLIYEST